MVNCLNLYRNLEGDQEIYTELQTRLRNLCEDRSSGYKSIVDFLRGANHNLRGG